MCIQSIKNALLITWKSFMPLPKQPINVILLSRYIKLMTFLKKKRWQLLTSKWFLLELFKIWYHQITFASYNLLNKQWLQSIKTKNHLNHINEIYEELYSRCWNSTSWKGHIGRCICGRPSSQCWKSPSLGTETTRHQVRQGFV